MFLPLRPASLCGWECHQRQHALDEGMRCRRRTRAAGRVLRLVAGPGRGLVQLFERVHDRLRCCLPHFAARLVYQGIAKCVDNISAGLVGQANGAAGLRRQPCEAGNRHRHAG